jgi:hypothetical protein
MDQVEKTPPKLFSKLDHLEAWVSLFEKIIYLHIQQKPESVKVSRMHRRVSLDLESVQKLENLLVLNNGDERPFETMIRIKGNYEYKFVRDPESTCWLQYGKPTFE